METLLFVTALPLKGGGAPVSVILPEQVDQGVLHVFAVALGE